LTIKWLSNQTSVVASQIQRQLGISLPVVFSQLTDERCSEIANDLNADFIVYLGTLTQASSKPEMFTAELLDRHLSAEAYRNIILEKKNFFAENRVIGKLPYVLGYRPIVAENGSVIGVVSVPTIYRQAEMNQELTRRDVFLYGAYAIALALSLVVGTVFANQISSPVRRLKLATQQIASGKLDVELPRKSGDELGELEQAFREMVRDLRNAQELMIKAQRELAWREMAKQIAHEIRNPLTPMKLSVQQLRQAYKDGAKDFGKIFQSISDTILVQIESLSKIATEFSYFARMPPRKIEVCNVHDILEEARSLYDQESKITFESDYAAEMPLVNADHEELRRAFINIMRNAVQALEHGGSIALRTRRSDGRVEIQIADTGPGISSESQRRLFEPNFSTKTEGMGLGLAIVKKIIDDLGGTISIDSTVGKGTTVSIRLPLVPENPKIDSSEGAYSED
jgi:nitrogen fixation/metabolism regulation signal transduction histidine kinase